MTQNLITRLSKLDAPDREVDAEIAFELLASPVGQHKEDGGPTGYIDLTDQPSWNLGLRFPGKDKAWFAATRKQIKGETLLIERDNAYVLMNSIRVPELTASVDAAIALARRLYPDVMYRVGNDGEGPDPSLYLGELFIPGAQKDSYFTGHSPVDAVSLCIALLRAKEAGHART